MTKYHNPKFADTQIQIPARIGVVGPSSAGKSIWLLNYIAKSSDTFGHIVVLYKQSENLYEFLRDKIGSKNITFYTKLTDLPAPNDLNLGNKQILMIFDDQVAEKNQQKIEEYYIRGRKIGGGITMCYLSQNFYGIPTLIRRQFNYVIILKMSGQKDLKQIIQNYSLGLDADEIVKLYKDATKDKFNFLKISTEERNDNKIFSKNFTGFYKITNESDDENEI
jgi:GTPase SAR1 family protein